MREDFVNSKQSSAERSIKYLLLRAVGLTIPQAQRMRDFRYCSIRKRIKIFLNEDGNPDKNI